MALFTSAMGVGAILAGLKLSMQGITRGLISLMLASTMITIISLIGFASIQNVWFATLLIFILGYAITSCTVASQTMIQNSIDDHVRGRVMSLWVAAARGGPAFGVLLIGWVADYTGLMWPNLFAALICFGGLLLVYVRRRAMVDYFEGEGGSGSSGV